MRYVVGDLVKIVNYDPMFNGRDAVILRIDGEYHYVRVIDNNVFISNTIQLYRNEIMTNDEFWNHRYPMQEYRVKAEPLPEDLFNV